MGGFQNPGVCLQAFPSSLPSPFPSPSFTHSIHRPVILCSRTAQKRLLRRLGRTSRIFIYGGMRDRSRRSGTKLAREIQLTDWSTAGNLSNRSSGVQIPRDICTRFGRYLYSTKCSWIIFIHESQEIGRNATALELVGRVKGLGKIVRENERCVEASEKERHVSATNSQRTTRTCLK